MALEIWDWYTTTLGRVSKEKRGADSLKVADLSIHVSQVRMRGPPAPDTLAIGEDISVLDRFNDEKSWLNTNSLIHPRFRSGISLACAASSETCTAV